MKTKVKKMNANDARNLAAAEAEKKRKYAEKLAKVRAKLVAMEKRAAEIIAKGDAITAADRRALINLINVAYHGSGKIEGCFSVDGSASCEFCQRMIAAAADNLLMICGCCYAAADSWKEAAWRRHKLNAFILSSVLFTAEELAWLPIDGTRCRFNEDGDTVNVTHGRNLLRIAQTRPGTFFGYWYKNEPAVSGALAAEGYTTRESLPENVRFIHSSALIGFPARATWYDDAIFTVWPDKETTEAAIKAGAWACNGRRCRACGYFCYVHERRPEAIQIAEVLRCGKDMRKLVRAAWDTRKAQEAA